MLYILTSDYFLWQGLSSALYPCQCKWGNEDYFQSESLQSISDDDVFIFDASANLYTVCKYVQKQNISPRFIYLKQKENISLEHIIKYCEVVEKKHSLNQCRAMILNNTQTTLQNGLVLSTKEVLILNLSISGLTVKQISVILGLDGKTIYAHRLNACRKLGVKRVGDLIPYKNLLLLKIAENELSHLRENVLDVTIKFLTERLLMIR